MLPRAQIRRIGAVALLFLAWCVLGCSADVAREPEPAITTPGAFLAVPDGGGFRIWRTFAEVRIDTGGSTFLFVRTYAPIAETLAEARALSRDPELTVERSSLLVPTPDPSLVTVIWFRTLTVEEYDEVFR